MGVATLHEVNFANWVFAAHYLFGTKELMNYCYKFMNEHT